MDHSADQIRNQLDVLKVLVVDDEHTMRRVTRSLLQAIGVKNIRDACDGRAGLDAVCSWAPDVVVLDWKMPNLERHWNSFGGFARPTSSLIRMCRSSC